VARVLAAHGANFGLHHAEAAEGYGHQRLADYIRTSLQ
jgi:hypothetical protein